ncbi:MAG: sulfotransferase, partial [Caulobacterales bacterium]|nr:sulfotransferase [Caulobacterales bacterium]
MSALPPRFFFCIGAGKGGTTWLHQQLRQHPEVFLSPEEGKETHYFNQIHGANLEFYLFRSNQRLAFFRERVLPRLAGGAGVAPDELAWWENFALNVIVNDRWYEALFAGRHDKVCGDITPAYALLNPAGVEHLQRVAGHAKV